MEERIQNIKNEALAQIMSAADREELEKLRVSYLGRKGELNEAIRKLSDIPAAKRKVVGQLINDAKEAIEKALEDQEEKLLKEAGRGEWFDVTVPAVKPRVGSLHAQTQVVKEILDIFNYLGYQVADGPQIEKDYYNFEVLNIPKHHPARDQQQTLWLDTKGTKYEPGEVILRTHTSAMQGHVMEATKPPFRVVVPGKCFRYEAVDASHGFEFWQVEGFMVDKSVTLTDLFGTIEYVLKRIFGKDAEVRFATTYFPFVEPGVDTYITCTVCKGRGCAFCKQSGWVEIMPAGMIHPNVLKQTGIDPGKWGGFAFAIGLSRVVTLKHGMDDLRLLTTPDLRILKQF